MKTKNEIIEELNILLEKRITQKKENMLKNACRNCTHKIDCTKEIDGFRYPFYKCQLGFPYNYDGDCKKFECLYNEGEIIREVRREIEDPALRGAKIPKIAALMWVLQDEKDVDKTLEIKGH